MKKMAFAICVLLLLLPAFAAENRVTVRVALSDSSGLRVPYREICVTDSDSDGELTVYDAIFCAHEKYSKGGFETEATEYGLSVTRLLGQENGGAYGYTVNDKMAGGLLDPVKEGDRVYAYCFSDLEGWSDAYCWFSESFAKPDPAGDVALTLYYQSFDSEWNPVSLPCAGAEILKNGEKTGIFTDDLGRIVVSVEKGETVISAVSDKIVLVPPVCVVSAAGGSAFPWIPVICAGAAAIAAAVTVILRKKK